MRTRSLLALTLLLAGCAIATTRPSEERLMIARAEEMARAGDYRGAQEAYQRAINDLPKNSSTDQALFGSARLYVAVDNPGRDYRRARENFERLLKEFPQSAWVEEARAWRELLSAFLSQREETETARQEVQGQREETEKARQEVQRIREEAEKARQEVQRIRQDLERLKQIERELERQRRR